MELSITSFKRPPLSPTTPKPKKTIRTMKRFHLDDFCDIILTEILHRVDTPRDCARCKTVSKRWKSLISSPYFITRFTGLHASSSYYQTHSTVLLTYISQQSRNPSIFVPMNFECCRYFDLTFSSLRERTGAVKIVASCHDLLLLSGDKGLYVHNPLTRQSVGISLLSKGYVQYGLVAEPYYAKRRRNRNIHGEFEINNDFEYVVICFSEEIDMECCIVDTYFPNSGRKKTNILSGPNKNFQFCSNIASCVWSKKLYWYNGSHVVVFDPFNSIVDADDDQTFFINARALDLPLNNVKFCDHCIGFPSRQMKIMQLVIFSYENRETTAISIWKLEHTTSRWFLEYRFNFHALMVKNPWFCQFVNEEEFNPKVLGFHPSDDDIVFLDMGKCVLFCALPTLKLFTTGQILTSGDTHYDHDNVFPIMQPWWPSPLETHATTLNARNRGAFTCFSL